MPLDPLHELTPVVTATHSAFVLLANPKVPAKTLPEFIAYLKANPGKLNHGSNSSTTIMISELFKQRAGVDYLDVNYRGAAKSIVATMAGTTQFCFVDIGSGTCPIEKDAQASGPDLAQALQAAAEYSDHRRAGTSRFLAYSPTLFMAPAKTPPALVKKIAAAFKQALDDTGDEFQAESHGIARGAGGQRRP